MLLSASQVTLFWRLWAAAVRAQGWGGLPKAEIELRRKAMLRECGFESLTAVDKTSGFDQVKRRLLELQDSVAAAMETDADAEARRLRAVIRQDLLPCLALYVGDAQAYLRAVMEDKTGWGKTDRPTRALELDDLSNDPVVRVQDGAEVQGDSPLRQCLLTLTSRVESFRRQAGHTRHQMRVLAGLPCRCRACQAEPVCAPF